METIDLEVEELQSEGLNPCKGTEDMSKNGTVSESTNQSCNYFL